MALSDFLFNTGNKIKMGLSQLAPSQNYVSLSGDYDPRQFDNYPTWYQGEKVQPRLTLAERLLGQQATPTDTMSADGNNLKITTSQNPRTGGILRDFAGGYQENKFSPASLDNLGQNTLEDGRKKGFAYRLGEGLGSISRLTNSPLGRGLIVGGLVSATGGNPLQALAYGGGATMLNQQNVLKDQMYRKDLESQGIDTTGIRGYMGDNVYGQLLKAKQLKDNAEYRKMYFDVNQANLQANREYQKQQDAIDNYFKQQGLDIQKQKILQDDKNKNEQSFENPKVILNNIEELWKKTPQGKAWKGTSKAKALQTGVANFLGMNNNEMSAYMAIAESMVTPLARQIAQEKGTISDKDISRARAMLPQATDSYEQGMAKINAVKKLLDDLEQTNSKTKVQAEETANTDPLGIL